MRITIEIDGKTVEAVEAKPAASLHLSADPPPELLAAARRLGAHSAGIAAFSMPAGETVSVSAIEARPVELADADAGAAPAAVRPQRRGSKAGGRSNAKSRRRRGG